MRKVLALACAVPVVVAASAWLPQLIGVWTCCSQSRCDAGLPYPIAVQSDKGPKCNRMMDEGADADGADRAEAADSVDAYAGSPEYLRYEDRLRPEEPGGRVLSRAGYDITPLSRARVAELAKRLDREAYRITQQQGTEPSCSGELLENDQKGTYCCIVCGLPLFKSDSKFDSGTGWPSYNRPVDAAHVLGKIDLSYGMRRIETVCARCDAHLGHVFSDGPKPTGLRFCINSAAMKFYEEGEELPAESRPVESKSEK